GLGLATAGLPNPALEPPPADTAAPHPPHDVIYRLPVGHPKLDLLCHPEHGPAVLVLRPILPDGALHRLGVDDPLEVVDPEAGDGGDNALAPGAEHGPKVEGRLVHVIRSDPGQRVPLLAEPFVIGRSQDLANPRLQLLNPGAAVAE